MKATARINPRVIAMHTFLYLLAPLRGMISIEYVGGNSAGSVSGNLPIDFAPIVHIDVTVDKHGGYVVPVGTCVSWLYTWGLEAHFIATVAEHIVLGAQLAAEQLLMSDLFRSGVRA